MATIEFQAKEGVKCAGCNWETSRLYVRAASREEADTLLHNTYGCSGCGKLEWEHGTLIGFFGENRETAEPHYTSGVPGACDDFSPNSDQGIDGAGLCGECYAEMQADSCQESGWEAMVEALTPLADLLQDLPSDPSKYVQVQLYTGEWAAIRDAFVSMKRLAEAKQKETP